MSRFAHKTPILLSLTSTEENGGGTVGSVVGVDAVPVLEERVTNDPGLEGTTGNESQAETTLEEVLDVVVLGGDTEVGSVEAEGSGELGVARVLVDIVGSALLSVLDGAGDTSPESSSLLVRTNDEGGTGVEGSNTTGVGDQVAVLDETAEVDVPVTEVNNGEGDEVTSVLGGVAPTNGHLRLGSGARDTSAEEESELVGGDLALGHGSLEVSGRLALAQTKAQTHDGANLRLTNTLGKRDNLSLVDLDASNGDAVEEVLTSSGRASTGTTKVGGSDVVLVLTLLVVLGGVRALGSRALGARNVEVLGSGVVLDGEGLGVDQAVSVVGLV